MLKYHLIILRYHLGTVAFGSLLLALIQLMRVAVEYINDRWDILMIYCQIILMSYLSFPRINNVTAQNKLIKGIVWFLRTCFFFLEKLIRYLNRSFKLSAWNHVFNQKIWREKNFQQECLHHDSNGGLELLQGLPGRLHLDHLQHPPRLLCQPGGILPNWNQIRGNDLEHKSPWPGGRLCNSPGKDLCGWTHHSFLQVGFDTVWLKLSLKKGLYLWFLLQHDCLRSRRRTSLQVFTHISFIAFFLSFIFATFVHCC